MARAPLVLLCDHRGATSQFERLQAALGPDYRLVHSSNLRTSLERLAAEAPSVLVVDPLVLGRGGELIALKHARGRDQDLPLLVVVDGGKAGLALDALSGVELGPWDLIDRGASDAEFRMRVGRLATEGRLRREMRDLRHRASHDDRTDLLRPDAFEARLHEHFAAARRHGLDLALVLLDLDRFGTINKELDHTIGDLVIAQVGEVVRKSLRTEDVAGRLGGDEFAAVLPYTRRADAATVVERLREGIKRLSGRPVGAAQDVAVSASIGFETFDGQDLGDAMQLRQHAERALREAKRQGGDQVVYFRSLTGPRRSDV